MPLINFRSDLTALQYGGDRPGGGSSGLPYLAFPRPENNSSNVAQEYYRGNREGLDFPIRGGVLNQGQRLAESTTPAGLIDRTRIALFLNDKPRGTIFLQKQKGLQLSNPYIQVPSIIRFQEGQTLVEEALVLPTRIYSDTASPLLAQVAAQGTGVHFERHGEAARLINPFQDTYEYFVSRNNTETTNRLAILAALKLGFTPAVRVDDQRVGGTTTANTSLPIQFVNARRYGVSSLATEILSYQGGPGSVYGIGQTVIRRASDTTDAYVKAVELYNTLTLSYRQLGAQLTREGTENWKPNLQDFREQIPGTMTGSYKNDIGWYTPRIQGDPGRARKFTDYTKFDEQNGVDRVSTRPVFYYDTLQNTPWCYDDGQISSNDTKDIIKFTFECLSNDNVAAKDGKLEYAQASVLVFRAFLSDFSDSHQGEYSSFKYVGRGETFRVYQGVDRSISFSFTVAAQSRVELRSVYKKVNHLISQVYPDYSTTNGYMRGTVIRLTIGDYLYRVPGFLENINITVGDSPWEINLEESTDVNQVPQVLNIQCNFKPIHDFLPRRETIASDGTGEHVPFIGDGEWISGDITSDPVKSVLERTTAAAATQLSGRERREERRRRRQQRRDNSTDLPD